ELLGQVTSHGTVNFTKQYSKGSLISYSGIISNGVIKGKFKSSALYGPFEVTMDKLEWNGHYSLGRSNFTFSFDMHLDDSGIFGLDKDSQGV
ncbi:hypothetical protein, partial [Listeria monocytogenes]|uniref:hypothetical protein n=1 Tax=Listeria monocytogenes TaxID=1639 RepID=UPI002FDC68A7